MKLFITNKPYLDQDNDGATVHKLAYAEMSSSIAEGCIPTEILISYYSKDFLFEFVNKRNEMYFYKYVAV